MIFQARPYLQPSRQNKIRTLTTGCAACTGVKDRQRQVDEPRKNTIYRPDIANADFSELIGTLEGQRYRTTDATPELCVRRSAPAG